MKGFEIRCNERTFIVPAEPVTPILIYQRYGYYYVDLEGWELKPDENILPKQRFNLILALDGVVNLEMRIIEEAIVAKLINDKVEDANSSPLIEEDIQQMIAKFNTLEKLLKQEGII
ncbi:hypothetical protein [Sphingobacterium lumbrici]|uniref:hypothetical protein n=1 Tax=Sphingobacterium lumbrici TaxID=2559600 RepID=UPI00112759E4|nr:hypothetical protein [Sphingobacterium lumbrici]